MPRKSLGTICVVGLGLIGSSVGLALRKRELCDEVLGFDNDPQAREKAMEMGAVDRTSDALNHLGSADLVVIAVPPPNVIPCLLEADVFCKPNAVVTDTSSVKSNIVAWTKTYPLKFRPRFVGGHPMIGKETSGAAGAEDDLFVDATWVLTPNKDTDRMALTAVKRMVRAIGGNVLLLSPEEHDRHAAVLSHLPHALASALVRMGAMLTHPEMAGPSWADLTRVAGSSPQLWQSIFANNRAEIVSAIEDLEFHLMELRQYIDQHDDEKVIELLHLSKKVKDEVFP
jgi:prephenate dehydrogenase